MAAQSDVSIDVGKSPERKKARLGAVGLPSLGKRGPGSGSGQVVAGHEPSLRCQGNGRVYGLGFRD